MIRVAPRCTLPPLPSLEANLYVIDPKGDAPADIIARCEHAIAMIDASPDRDSPVQRGFRSLFITLIEEAKRRVTQH